MPTAGKSPSQADAKILKNGIIESGIESTSQQRLPNSPKNDNDFSKRPPYANFPRVGLHNFAAFPQRSPLIPQQQVPQTRKQETAFRAMKQLIHGDLPNTTTSTSGYQRVFSNLNPKLRAARVVETKVVKQLDFNDFTVTYAASNKETPLSATSQMKKPNFSFFGNERLNDSTCVSERITVPLSSQDLCQFSGSATVLQNARETSTQTQSSESSRRNSSAATNTHADCSNFHASTSKSDREEIIATAPMDELETRPLISSSALTSIHSSQQNSQDALTSNGLELIPPNFDSKRSVDLCAPFTSRTVVNNAHSGPITPQHIQIEIHKETTENGINKSVQNDLKENVVKDLTTQKLQSSNDIPQQEVSAPELSFETEEEIANAITGTWAQKRAALNFLSDNLKSRKFSNNLIVNALQLFLDTNFAVIRSSLALFASVVVSSDQIALRDLWDQVFRTYLLDEAFKNRKVHDQCKKIIRSYREKVKSESFLFTDMVSKIKSLLQESDNKGLAHSQNEQQNVAFILQMLLEVITGIKADIIFQFLNKELITSLFQRSEPKVKEATIQLICALSDSKIEIEPFLSVKLAQPIIQALQTKLGITLTLEDSENLAAAAQGYEEQIDLQKTFSPESLDNTIRIVKEILNESVKWAERFDAVIRLNDALPDASQFSNCDTTLINSLKASADLINQLFNTENNVHILAGCLQVITKLYNLNHELIDTKSLRTILTKTITMLGTSPKKFSAAASKFIQSTLSNNEPDYILLFFRSVGNTNPETCALCLNWLTAWWRNISLFSSDQVSRSAFELFVLNCCIHSNQRIRDLGGLLLLQLMQTYSNEIQSLISENLDTKQVNTLRELLARISPETRNLEIDQLLKRCPNVSENLNLLGGSPVENTPYDATERDSTTVLLLSTHDAHQSDLILSSNQHTSDNRNITKVLQQSSSSATATCSRGANISGSSPPTCSPRQTRTAVSLPQRTKISITESDTAKNGELQAFTSYDSEIEVLKADFSVPQSTRTSIAQSEVNSILEISPIECKLRRTFLALIDNLSTLTVLQAEQYISKLPDAQFLDFSFSPKAIQAIAESNNLLPLEYSAAYILVDTGKLFDTLQNCEESTIAHCLAFLCYNYGPQLIELAMNFAFRIPKTVLCVLLCFEYILNRGISLHLLFNFALCLNQILFLLEILDTKCPDPLECRKQLLRIAAVLMRTVVEKKALSVNNELRYQLTEFLANLYRVSTSTSLLHFFKSIRIDPTRTSLNSFLRLVDYAINSKKSSNANRNMRLDQTSRHNLSENNQKLIISEILTLNIKTCEREAAQFHEELKQAFAKNFRSCVNLTQRFIDRKPFLFIAHSLLLVILQLIKHPAVTSCQQTVFNLLNQVSQKLIPVILTSPNLVPISVGDVSDLLASTLALYHKESTPLHRLFKLFGHQILMKAFCQCNTSVFSDQILKFLCDCINEAATQDLINCSTEVQNYFNLSLSKKQVFVDFIVKLSHTNYVLSRDFIVSLILSAKFEQDDVVWILTSLATHKHLSEIFEIVSSVVYESLSTTYFAIKPLTLQVPAQKVFDSWNDYTSRCGCSDELSENFINYNAIHHFSPNLFVVLQRIQFRMSESEASLNLSQQNKLQYLITFFTELAALSAHNQNLDSERKLKYTSNSSIIAAIHFAYGCNRFLIPFFFEAFNKFLHPRFLILAHQLIEYHVLFKNELLTSNLSPEDINTLTELGVDPVHAGYLPDDFIAKQITTLLMIHEKMDERLESEEYRKISQQLTEISALILKALALVCRNPENFVSFAFDLLQRASHLNISGRPHVKKFFLNLVSAVASVLEKTTTAIFSDISQSARSLVLLFEASTQEEGVACCLICLAQIYCKLDSTRQQSLTKAISYYCPGIEKTVVQIAKEHSVAKEQNLANIYQGEQNDSAKITESTLDVVNNTQNSAERVENTQPCVVPNKTSSTSIKSSASTSFSSSNVLCARKSEVSLTLSDLIPSRQRELPQCPDQTLTKESYINVDNSLQQTPRNIADFDISKSGLCSEEPENRRLQSEIKQCSAFIENKLAKLQEKQNQIVSQQLCSNLAVQVSIVSKNISFQLFKKNLECLLENAHGIQNLQMSSVLSSCQDFFSPDLEVIERAAKQIKKIDTQTLKSVQFSLLIPHILVSSTHAMRTVFDNPSVPGFTAASEILLDIVKRFILLPNFIIRVAPQQFSDCIYNILACLLKFDTWSGCDNSQVLIHHFNLIVGEQMLMFVNPSTATCIFDAFIRVGTTDSLQAMAISHTLHYRILNKFCKRLLSKTFRLGESILENYQGHPTYVINYMRLLNRVYCALVHLVSLIYLANKFQVHYEKLVEIIIETFVTLLAIAPNLGATYLRDTKLTLNFHCTRFLQATSIELKFVNDTLEPHFAKLTHGNLSYGDVSNKFHSDFNYAMNIQDLKRFQLLEFIEEYALPDQCLQDLDRRSGVAYNSRDLALYLDDEKSLI